MKEQHLKPCGPTDLQPGQLPPNRQPCPHSPRIPAASISTALSQETAAAWARYVQNHPRGTCSHLPGWNQVIQRAYGHRTYHLSIAKAAARQTSAPLAGVLSLVHMNHFLFGNKLVSLPYMDSSGILADDVASESELANAALTLGKTLGVDFIELRQAHPIGSIPFGANAQDVLFSMNGNNNQKVTPGEDSSPAVHLSSQKVRMLLELPQTASQLMSSFRSKLRSQIRKPVKEGCTVRMGGAELLDDFYRVFLVNMRDLGSPVHSMDLMKQLWTEFPGMVRIVVVYKDSTPLATSIVMGFNGILQNPWASSLKEFSALSPNMLLYWTMLEYACDQGFNWFDFGRSTPGEGTHRFKEQWGARPVPLNWYTIPLNGKAMPQSLNDKSRFDKVIQYWQKIPVPLTRYLGPYIRKHISL